MNHIYLCTYTLLILLTVDLAQHISKLFSPDTEQDPELRLELCGVAGAVRVPRLDAGLGPGGGLHQVSARLVEAGPVSQVTISK